MSTGRDAPPTSFDEIYQQQWWPMLRLATGLVDSVGTAEDVVQDAFAALFRRWDALREPAAAVGYLRASVVNGARSVLRRRGTARKHLRVVAGDTVEPADGVHLALDRTVFLDGKATFVNDDRTTYDYLVPTKVFDSGGFNGAITRGTEVYLRTDGHRVLEIFGD